MTNILLILDGFSFDYTKNEKFKQVIKDFNFVVPMKPSAGWSSKPTLYNGNSTKTNNLFTQYWKASNPFFKWLKIKTHLQLSPMFATIFNSFFRRVFKYNILYNTSIPLNTLRYFSVSEGYEDALKLKHLNTLTNDDLEIIYTKDIDESGHIFGKTSIETEVEVEKAAKLISSLRDRKDLENLIIVGDHGMEDVIKTIDIQKLLKDRGIKFNDKIQFFIDSTIIRFWSNDEVELSKVKRVLNQLKDEGKLLSKQDLKENALDFSHNKYGDSIFWLKSGRVFRPSYYHRWTLKQNHINKGMHGYLEDKTIFGIYSKKKLEIQNQNDVVDMTSFYPTVMTLLNKKYECEGVSIIK